MAKIEFLGPIDKDDMELDIKNLHQLKEILSKDEKMKDWLEVSSVAVNDTLVSSLNVEIKSGDKISLLPPVCGG